jgi:RNA binding exosome subunit
LIEPINWTPKNGHFGARFVVRDVSLTADSRRDAIKKAASKIKSAEPTSLANSRHENFDFHGVSVVKL